MIGSSIKGKISFQEMRINPHLFNAFRGAKVSVFS